MPGVKATTHTEEENVVRDTLLRLEKDDETPMLPDCSHEELQQCMTHLWVQHPRLKRNTFKTRVVPLPLPHFEAWLSEEGLHLPPSEPSGAPSTEQMEREEALLQLRKDVDEAIGALGGQVFPKLNFSAPLDAAWMALDNTLKCQSADDVFILLKSSDRLQHDLQVLRQLQQPSLLILKKYYELNRSMEFRCFVRAKQLVGISQRDTYHFYPFLLEIEEDICRQIEAFYASVLLSSLSIDNYCFDVYISPQQKVTLIDINPWADSTLPLLFEWPELLSASDCSLRLVRSEAETTKSFAPSHSENRLPLDVLQMMYGANMSEVIDTMSAMQHDEDDSEEEA